MLIARARLGFIRSFLLYASATGNGYSLKDKNQAKTDKTEHGNEKSVKKSKSRQPVKKSTVKVNKSKPKMKPKKS
ncbi:hypothetical protein Tco_1528157 [Tanacetum coccineum]